jgi:hypothetical protein
VKFVEIKRGEFEEWLVAACPVFERPNSREDVYLVPLAPALGVKLAMRFDFTMSPTGRRVARNAGDPMTIDDVAVKSCIVGVARRTDGKLLRDPQRPITATGIWLLPTENWCSRWQTELSRWVSHCWDRRSLYELLSSAGARKTSARRAEESSSHYPWPPRSEEESAKQLEAVLQLQRRRVSNSAGDRWLQDFTRNLLERLQALQPLSERQEFILHEKLVQYQLVAAGPEAPP